MKYVKSLYVGGTKSIAYVLRHSMIAGLVAGMIAIPALAAGLWPNLPIVGSAAFCASQNTAGVPGTSAVCSSTAPAGPSIVTGLETIPADTGASTSQKTVKLTLASLNALPVTMTAGSSTAATALTPTTSSGGFIITGAAALSPTTVYLPASPIDGQQFRLSSTHTIASLTVAAASGSGQTISNAPTAITISTTAAYGYLFRYDSDATTWYRLQ